MGEDPRANLRALLGDQVVAGLETLDDEEAGRLAAAVREARSAERRDLREAAEKSLDTVPRFARGAVKKVVLR